MIRTRDIHSIKDGSFGLWQLLFSLAGAEGIDFNARGEAPDYYETVTVRHWGSGTRTKVLTGPARTVTETISYDESATFTRIPIHTSVTHVATDQLAYGAVDQFEPDPPGSGECYIGIARMPRNTPYLSRHYLIFDFYETRDVDIGTTDVDYDDPGTPDTSDPITIGLEFLPWYWSTDPTPPTNFGDPWNVLNFYQGGGGFSSIAQFDPSSISDWRDLRGTYSVTVADSDIDGSWDTNTITHHTSITVA